VQPSHCSAAGVPHEVVGDQLAASLEGIEQRDGATLADERRRGIHLDHGQAPARSGDRVAFPRVRLFAPAQGIQLGLEGAPVDHRRDCQLACHVVISTHFG
jgi:hypothetical protein